MRRLAVLPFLLLAACSSSKSSFDIPESRILDCEHGDVEVRVGVAGPSSTMEQVDDRVTYNVEVANNSRHDVVVKWIRVEQTHIETAPYRLGNGYRTFNETIRENEDHLFELPVTGRGIRDYSGRSLQSSGLSLSVAVSLEGGDVYRCLFSVPAPP